MKESRATAQEQSIHYQTPPNNIDAEAALLSAVLIDNHILNEVVDVVSAPDFYKSAHQIIFSCMLELSKRRDPIDLVSLAELLGKKKKLEAAGGTAEVK